MFRSRSRLWRLAAVLGLLLLGGGWWWHGRRMAGGGGVVIHPDRLFTVKRGDLQIGFSHSGTISALKKHKMAPEAGFNTKLVWTIEENARVVAGDVLMKFETEDLEIRIDDLALELSGSEKELAILLEERRILESTNLAGTRAARDHLTATQDAASKYRRLEGPKEMDQHALRVSEALRLHEAARNDYDKYVLDSADQTYINPTAEEKARQQELNLKQAMDKAKVTYQDAVLDRKLFKRHTYPNTLTKLANDIAQAELELEKALVMANSQLAQKDNQITNLEAKIKRVRRDLEKHQGYLPQMQLVAPVDGVVIYGDPDRRWGNPEIQIGMDVRRGMTLCTIPDMSVLSVNFELAERYRSRVEVGTRVLVNPESIPDLRLGGKIEKIAPLPVNQIHWDQSSPRIYPSNIELDASDDPRLVNGMSVRIEIITEVVKDAVHVPIEAVFEEKGEYLVYVRDGAEPRRRTVQIGQASDSYVQIREGLEPGEVVFLYRPFQTKSTKPQ
jgi:RND family efflux transporter MFP subunit